MGYGREGWRGPAGVIAGAESRRDFCRRAGVDESCYLALEREYLESKLPERIMKGADTRPGGARVVRDRYGIPHVFAGDSRDLYLACGFAQAQDRLWQLDYRRRLARGTLAEVMGTSALKTDVEHRTIGLLQAADLELGSLDEGTAEALYGFAAGVNRWMDLAADCLPVEFDVLGYEPAPWTPLDSLAVLRYFWWTLTGRLEQIVSAERLLRKADPVVAAAALSAESGEYIVPFAGDACSQAQGGGDEGFGSNNWAAGPKVMSTGMPSLASDPHWPVSFPSMWYEQHLSAPGVDCIGAAYPGAPPVVFGRTRFASWGRTNNVSSTRDLYCEEVNPEDPNLYRDGDRWAGFETRRERVKVRGSGAVEVAVRLTRRGPVVNEIIPRIEPAGDGPITLRWTGHEVIGDARALLALNRARSAAEVRAVFEDWRLSVWNAVYVDSRGSFGYQMCGSLPVRRSTARGTRGVGPDDEWGGYAGTSSLPGMHDPERGWVASANNAPAPQGALGGVTGAYADGYRMRRIGEILGRSERLTPVEVRDIQSDTLDLRARNLKGLMASMLTGAASEGVSTLGGILDGWNCRFDSDQVGATVWSALWPRFARLALLELAGEYAGELSAGSPGALPRAVLTGEFSAAADGLSVRLALQAAADTYDWLVKSLGADPSAWQWGRAHMVLYEHPLAVNDEAKRVFNLGPFGCPGGGGTVNNRRPVETVDGFRNASGVSYRFFVDMSEPARAWGATLTGQSGQPGSAHYAERVEETLEGEYHPLLMERSEIDEVSEFEFDAGRWIAP